jgi:hypothetical protein
MYRFAVVRRPLFINRRGQTSRRIVARRTSAGCDKYVVRLARLHSMTAASADVILERGPPGPHHESSSSLTKAQLELSPR